MPINISGALQSVMGSVVAAKGVGELAKNTAFNERSQKATALNELNTLTEQVDNARVADADIDSKEAIEALEFGTDQDGNQITLETKRDTANEELASIARQIAEHDAKNGPTESQTGAVKGQRTRLVNRLNKAQTAFDDLQNEINARTAIRNNYKILQSKLADKKKIYNERFGGNK